MANDQIQGVPAGLTEVPIQGFPAGLTEVPVQKTQAVEGVPPGLTEVPLAPSAAAQSGAYQTKPGGPIRNVNPLTDTDTSNWPHVKLSSGETHMVHPEDVS